MRTTFTLGEFRAIGHEILNNLKKQDEAKMLKPGALEQSTWIMTQLDKRLEMLPENGK